MNELECENGHCEYGFCVCDEYWIGDKCDSLTYIDHSGDYFGGYECNNITVTTDIVSVSGTEDQDTFRFTEELTGQRSNEFDGDLSSAIKHLDGVD